MTTNIQSFAGDVEINNGNLSVKSLEVKDNITKLASNNSSYSNVGILMTRKDGASNVAFLFTETGANVVLGYTNNQGGDDDVEILTDANANLMVYGNVYVSGSVHGDGSTLTGLVTTLQSVTEFGANTTQMVDFENPTTGINVHSNVLVAGNVTATTFIGDGSQLDGIAATLEEIVINANTTANTVEFRNATSLVTTGNVGISNLYPTADLCVGANVVIDDDARDVVQVTGNVNCHGLFLQSVSILPGYGLDTVTGISNSTPNTISITNSTLSLITSSMAGIGIVPDSTDVSSKGLHVDGHLRLGGPANTTDNEQMYLKTAGALSVLANDSDTTNQDTKLILQTGGTSNSNITLEGNTDQQFMTFGVGATERMRIEETGNVGINVASASYTLDVGGDIRFDGNLYQGDGPFVATPWTITGDDIYYTVADGSVGIGTATTEAKFHTEGNVYINSYASDSTSNGGVVIDGGIAVSGNVHTGNLYVVNNVHIQSVQVDATPSLQSISLVGSTTDQAIAITNTTASTSVGSGALTVDGGVGVDGNLYVGGNLAFPTPAVATTAGNVITWNSTTGLLEDSGGLLANKFAVVSEQPPSALTANSTTVTDHGVYKLTTSGLATDSNTWNAFNGDSADAWTSLSTYTVDNAHDGSVQLSAVSSTGSGEWLAVEFPYKTTLRHMKLTPAAVASYPGTANLYATNDSTSWTLLKEWSDVVPGSASEVQTVVVDSAASYKKYAIVPTKAAGASTSVAIAQWQLFAESFAVDGGKVALAAAAITGGNTVVDQTGPHARASPPLRKYPEIVFTEGEFDTTANGTESTYWAGPSTVFQGGYSLKTSHHSTGDGGSFGWEAFDGNEETFWKNPTDYESSTGNYDYGNTGVQSRLTDTSSTNHDGDHVIMGSPNKLKIAKVVVTCKAAIRRVVNYSVLGSNLTGTTGWTLLNSGTFNAQDVNTATITSPTSYFKYHAFVVRSVTPGADGQRFQINSIDFYGYEEDPPAGDTSVDTTITSQFNLPDTTGVKLYIDGDKGSTPTDYSGEGHTLTDNSESFSGNAWSFSSLATSNVTMTSGDFAMEGTHPHSVSLWFNAANVSSNATLFHVGTEAGEGDAKTAISLTETGHLGWIDGGDNQFVTSNTWHNLVYATQGGGGLRTCYLDGRKLGDVSDQDTFGDYPPFAMSTFSEYGYTVSTGDPPHDQNQFVWKAFDSNVSTFWYSHPGSSDADSTYFDGNPRGNDGQSITDSDGTTHTGSWGKIEFPHKFVLNYLEVQGGTPVSSYYPHNPNNYVILGSNDDETWDLLSTRTGASPTTDGMTSGGTQIDRHTVNAQKAYKYIIFLVTQISTVLGGGREFIIASLRLYGHKENDTTRFPISSTVLKYPHIAMTGPAQRGYVASASNTNIGAERYPWKLFDDSTDTQWQMSDTNNSSSEGYDLTSPYDANNNSPTITDNNGNDHTGAWVKLQLPVAINISSMYIHAKSTNRRPDSAVLLGSNDDSTWYVIKDTFTIANQDENTISISTSSYYKYVMFLVKSLTGGEGQLQINLINYYGTEEDLDIVARVGEGLDGKVANFRVYDKYLHEEQALELWDAQKDQFGRATSSVVVHKGRLGVGTTEPEGRFAVLDEPGDVEEFPPRAMTAAETYMDGHGVFKASSSPTYNDSYPAYYAFDKVIPYNTTANQWVSQGGTYDGASPKSFPVTSGDKAVLFEGTYGSWIQLSLPYKILLKRMVSFIRLNRDHEHATSGIVYGSNDGETHEIVYTFDDVPVSDQLYDGVHHEINATKAYSTYTFQITKLEGVRTFTPLGELKFFGTRQGQSTLHDGELKLTKNLTVPRIGPPLDADDTPRRDKLVVEYNTSTNPTGNGVVRDTSGGGRDGLIRGSASYDATEKAFDIVASSDILTTGTNIGGVSGDFLASVSLWFKPSTVTSATSQILFIHTSAYAVAASFLVNIYEDQISVGHGSTNNSYKDGSLVANEWYHVVAIKKGTGDVSNNIYEIYLNGTKLTLTNGEGTDVMNVSSDQAIMIGSARESTVNTEQFVGKISNVKYYPGVVLTATEVKRLYDMGRLGNVIAQPVHIAAPLQVEKTLRVPIDGTAAGTTGMIRFNTNSGKLQVHTGTAWFDVGGTSAAGGTVSYADGYTIHTFEDGGDFTVYSGGEVEFLVVAGGGGGSNTLYCGGGGAGGMLTGTLDLPSGTYTITVGEGGATGENGADGSDSEFHTQLANGGGGGATYNVNGRDGGSGGGGGYATGNAGGGLGMLGGGGTAEQGNNGGRGNAVNGYGWGGGGGGAGAVGKTANSTTGQVGAGGNGLQSSITGTSTYYAGGGGGRVDSGGYDVPGGLGGGGDGNDNNGDGTAGAENTGGGGGPSKAGGSGIVIIRYLT
jgi:hypothetical protein